MTYRQSPLLFCGLFDFFASWLACDVTSTELWLQVNCDLTTFGDTLRDGSRLAKFNGTFAFKEAQNSNISVRSLGSKGPFSAGNHAITRGFVR